MFTSTRFALALASLPALILAQETFTVTVNGSPTVITVPSPTQGVVFVTTTVTNPAAVISTTVGPAPGAPTLVPEGEIVPITINGFVTTILIPFSVLGSTRPTEPITLSPITPVVFPATFAPSISSALASEASAASASAISAAQAASSAAGSAAASITSAASSIATATITATISDTLLPVPGPGQSGVSSSSVSGTLNPAQSSAIIGPASISSLPLSVIQSQQSTASTGLAGEPSSIAVSRSSQLSVLSSVLSTLGSQLPSTGITTVTTSLEPSLVTSTASESTTSESTTSTQASSSSQTAPPASTTAAPPANGAEGMRRVERVWWLLGPVFLCTGAGWMVI